MMGVAPLLILLNETGVNAFLYLTVHFLNLFLGCGVWTYPRVQVSVSSPLGANYDKTKEGVPHRTPPHRR